MQVASPASLAAQAQAELITQPLYAARTVATSATSTNFFDGTSAADRRLTNVDQANQLPHPKFFRIGGFRLVPQVIATAAPEDEVDDQYALHQSGYYEFKIGDLKPYLTVPNLFIPGGVGLQFRGVDNRATSAGQFSGSWSNGEAVFGNFLRIKHWISIPPLQSFGATIHWTSLTLNASHILWNFLDGEFGREVL